MSNDKRDRPHAGHQEGMEYERDRQDTRPEKGRLFQRRGDGSVLLTQTDQLYARPKKGGGKAPDNVVPIKRKK